MAKPKRTITEHQEVSRSRIYRDTRSTGAKAIAWLRSAEACLFTLPALGAFSFVVPHITETAAMISAAIYLGYVTKKHKLPFRMPMHSGEPDYSDLHPKTKKPQKASGLFFLGNNMEDQEELWYAKKDVCTHMLMLATTGSGKTEAILSVAMNALAQGSGFTMVDGKGDVSLLSKVYSMCKVMGREDDFLVINYNTGNIDVGFDTPDQKLSNTLNPFTFGSSSSLTQLLVSLMSDSGGKGDFWKDRAISLVESIIPALVWKRDKQNLLLDVSVIRDYLNLARIVELRKINEMPQNIQESLRAYCENLAGWNERKGASQGDTTMEQHGYLQMQFTRTLGSLGDVYGHIFRTPLGEVDMYDVVTNRRILLVMLPALEKSPAELANLGKILVALIKGMMASALGSRFEGSAAEVLDDRFTNADSPYQTLFDEYGAYAVDGAHVMPAQARSLNIQMLFAGQDYAGFKRSGEESAISIIANCNIKIFGKVEDGDGTFGVYKQQVGDVYVTHARGYEVSDGFLGGYKANRDASIEQVSRANLQDLKDLEEGQMIVLFKSKLIPTKMFYADPPKPAFIRLNEFLKVRPPSIEVLSRLDENMSALINKLQSKEFAEDLPEATEIRDITFMMESMQKHQSLSLLERSAAVIAEYHQENVRESESLTSEEVEAFGMDEEFDGMPNIGKAGRSNVFTKPQEFGEDFDLAEMTSASMNHEKTPTQQMIEDMVGGDYADDVHRAMSNMAALDASELSHDISSMEVQMGATEVEAAATSNEVIQTIDDLTEYPKTPAEPMPAEEYIEAISMLEDIISDQDEQQ
ncbi:MAG: phosphoesterase [Methylotenera sp.]|uniref:TraM recognition domain-containing protein n=1 Tax=Methylotenera sp. TaxID=2051956 RepID=UPI000D4B4DAF|nr:hypothetical protein [Methylotenera sp.]PPC84807.1 MAG: phosphoesterase [Methylotenera sp.]PPD02167.1 MAG: phosphoesterase [Methylotenera sp.]